MWLATRCDRFATTALNGPVGGGPDLPVVDANWGDCRGSGSARLYDCGAPRHRPSPRRERLQDDLIQDGGPPGGLALDMVVKAVVAAACGRVEPRIVALSNK